MKILLIIFLVYLTICSNLLIAQNTETIDSLSLSIVTPIKFKTNKKDDAKLDAHLQFMNTLISIMCNPKVNPIEYKDLKSDSTDLIELTKNQTFISIKNSYTWNIDEEVPQIPKTSVIKSLLKNKDKISNDEWKVLRFMEFYTDMFNYRLIESFVNTQEIIVNNQNEYKISYLLKFNEHGKLLIENKNVEEL